MVTTSITLEARGLSKRFQGLSALRGVSFTVRGGTVACLLGDNGAGKSTLIKTLSGVLQPDSGTLLFNDQTVRLRSPKDAMDLGIATVHQDLGVVPIMPVWRNFFLGREPLRNPLPLIDAKLAKRVTREQLHAVGIRITDVDRPIGTLSGGQRQAVAIARAAHFGAKVLILDEPTSALGVSEAGIVLRYIDEARTRGLAVIFVTHNIHHAYPVGDTFTFLDHGQCSGTYEKNKIGWQDVLALMAGGERLEELRHELAGNERDGHDGRQAQ
jgi:simple sugar transport system ATP-binding protein